MYRINESLDYIRYGGSFLSKGGSSIHESQVVIDNNRRMAIATNKETSAQPIHVFRTVVTMWFIVVTSQKKTKKKKIMEKKKITGFTFWMTGSRHAKFYCITDSNHRSNERDHKY